MGKKGYAGPQSPRSGGSGNEQRIDPADGHRVTWEELRQKYDKQYKAFQITHYWYNECKRARNPLAETAKAQVEEAAAKEKVDKEAAAAKAKVEKAAAKAKAEQEAAAAKAKQEAAAAKAKAEQEAAAKAKVEEAAAKAKIEEAKKEAAAKAESKAAPKEDVKAKAPLCAAFMKRVGDLTNKICKRT